eukprot:8236397-Ditylum_brightwellii.AAC.1
MVKSINALAREFVSTMIEAAGNNKGQDDMNAMKEDLMRHVPTLLKYTLTKLECNNAQMVPKQTPKWNIHIRWVYGQLQGRIYFCKPTACNDQRK